MQFEADGDRHFTDDGSVADITVDLVLRARAKMAEETSQRGLRPSRDRNEQTTPSGHIYEITKYFPDLFRRRRLPALGRS